MATLTPNLNLILPDYSDKADISVLNDNFQKIDEYCANDGGAGTVTSVNKVAPDATGNVTLTAENVGALSSGGTAKNSEKLGDQLPEYYAKQETINQLSQQKANVIIDTAPKAASHELHAQDGRLAVTLYGKTTETGTGDKSPDNPYTISGVDEANVHAGSKNLLLTCTVDITNTANGITAIWNRKTQKISLNGTNTATSGYLIINSNSLRIVPNFKPGQIYTLLANAPVGVYVQLTYYNTSGKNMAMCYSNSTRPVTFTVPDDYARFNGVQVGIGGAATTLNVNDLTIMLEAGSTAHAWEPYNANVINPPLLPDGSPLMGNGTVDDTVENWVLSGCDKCVVFDGSIDENWFLDAVGVREAFRIDNEVLANRVDRNAANNDGEVSYLYSNQLTTEKYSTVSKEGIGASMRGTNYNGSFIVMYPAGTFGTVDAFRAHLAANPLTVYYRSTAYTPDKDLRVCKTVRNWHAVTLTGDENILIQSVNANGLVNVELRYITNGWPSQKTWPYAESSHFKTDATLISNATVEGIVTSTKDVAFLRIRSDRLLAQTADGVKEYLAVQNADGNPVVIKYQLATPEVYMTDPLPLRKPDGMDVVTVTGSGETAVTYPRDTKDFGKAAASAMIGAAESGMTATQNYASGAFIVNKDTLTLYRATKAIAKGETITPGTNCAATTVVEQLANLYTLLNA